MKARPEWAWYLTSLAYSAKAHWRYPVEWLFAWREALLIRPETIASGGVFVAIIENSIVGFSAIQASVPRTTLDHLWVFPRFAGRGIGRRLFIRAAEEAASLGAAELWIESDPNALGFYLRCGASLTGYSHSEIQGTSRLLPVLNYCLRP